MSTCPLLLYNAVLGNGSHCSPHLTYLSKLVMFFSLLCYELPWPCLYSEHPCRGVRCYYPTYRLACQKGHSKSLVGHTQPPPKPHAVKSTSGPLAPSEGMVRTDIVRKGILKFNRKYLVLHNHWAAGNQERLPVSLKQCHF